MKWIFLAVLAIVALIVFRRLNRDQRISPEGSWSTPTPAPTASSQPAGFDKWSGRVGMSFDDFYNQYYATAGIDREHVAKMLEFISKAGGVPADKLRPEDRIDEFPKPNLARTIAFIKTLLTGPLARLTQQMPIDPATLQIETVDDIMRHMDMHKEFLAAHGNKVEDEHKGFYPWS